MVVAFLVVRKRFWGRGTLDFGVMLGVAIPGTIFGIGYLLAFNTPTEVFGFTLIPKLTGGAAVLGGAIAIAMVGSMCGTLEDGVFSFGWKWWATFYLFWAVAGWMVALERFRDEESTEKSS